MALIQLRAQAVPICVRFQVSSGLEFQLGFIQSERGFIMWRNELQPREKCSKTEQPILSSTVKAH